MTDTPRLEVVVAPVWDADAVAEVERRVRETVDAALEEALATMADRRSGAVHVEDAGTIVWSGQRWLSLGPADEPLRGGQTADPVFLDREGDAWWRDPGGDWRSWNPTVREWVLNTDVRTWAVIQREFGPMTRKETRA